MTCAAVCAVIRVEKPPADKIAPAVMTDAIAFIDPSLERRDAWPPDAGNVAGRAQRTRPLCGSFRKLAEKWPEQASGSSSECPGERPRRRLRRPTSLLPPSR